MKEVIFESLVLVWGGLWKLLLFVFVIRAICWVRGKITGALG